MGMVGNMGALSPLGYIFPGIMMDLVLWFASKLNFPTEDSVITANAIGAVCASLAANLIVFRLNGLVLLLYLCVSATSGAMFGMLGSLMIKRLKPIMKYQVNNPY